MSRTFKRSKIFNADSKKILFLINNFEAYQDFLPGCLESSELPCQEDGSASGRLVFSILNKTYEFKSLNRTEDLVVNIIQSEGPFINFNASWKLEPINSQDTKVNFEATFSLPFFLKIFAQQSLIDQLGLKFIAAFEDQLKR
ncbi:MAG: SRPBCC family protein [SAR86 cluster bacterium]|jgi:ribosome-associated toxin RatA of RatAB toxin-antitoxin module|nr:hypothetical protein [Gammaproteobacteria bacterium]MDG2347231.1 SRPBCC family protein [SAR86 cluster bacterium]|tara:strand:+ start:270 stop:695 length:426 start_codon:yes stop_codon:yes gene_type:complete